MGARAAKLAAPERASHSERAVSAMLVGSSELKIGEFASGEFIKLGDWRDETFRCGYTGDAFMMSDCSLPSGSLPF